MQSSANADMNVCKRDRNTQDMTKNLEDSSKDVGTEGEDVGGSLWLLKPVLTSTERPLTL